MPFEVVQYPDTSPETSGTEVTVHWSRNGHVQLEVVRHVWEHNCPNGCDGVNSCCDSCPRGTTAEFDASKFVVTASGSGQLVSRGAPNPLAFKLGVTSAEADSPVLAEELQCALVSNEEAQIYTDVLSRQHINKLIRVLRRARDQAYGEDA